MRDFGRWFVEQGAHRPAPPQAHELPDGIREASDGVYMVRCCICERDFEWPVEPELFEPGMNNYCGGSPSCCP